MECAVKMLFIVKFVVWEMRFPYPLGVIVSALPCVNTVSTQCRYLKISHNILPTPQIDEKAAVSVATRVRSFETVFTIDSEHAMDRSNGLTCKLLTVQVGQEIKKYEVGVHITDVQQYVAKGSEIDEAAYKRGCSTYQSSKSLVASMLPSKIVQLVSLLQGNSKNSFTVLFEITLGHGKIIDFGTPSVIQSRVKSKAQLSYREAQEVLCGIAPFHEKVRQYDENCRSDNLVLRDKLHVLWKLAILLRRDRLGNRAGSCFTIDEEEVENAPEAYFLVHEVAIWANRCFAKRVLSSYPDSTLLHSKAQTNEGDLRKLKEQNGSYMSASFSLYKMAEKHKAPICFLMLTEVIKKIKDHLSKEDTREALHQIQFEHLHPQPSVANEGFRAIQCKSYCCVSSHTTPQPHTSFDCTSPIRRYADLVSQRLLYASLNDKRCPYTSEELSKVCNCINVSARNSSNFEQDMKHLELALKLLQSSKEYLAIIWSVEKGSIYLCYPDCSLTPHPKQAMSILLKDLNSCPTSVSDSSQKGKFSASWKVKMCSLKCSPINFLSTCDLKVCKGTTSLSRKADITFYVPDGEDCFSSHLSPRTYNVRVKPFTQDIPVQVWEYFVQCAQTNPEDINIKEMLSHLPQESDSAPSLALPEGYYPMWIYTVRRPIEPCEVVKLQLSAALHNNHPETAVQLFEVAPMLHVCVQHNSNPSDCFVSSLSTNASKPKYDSIVEYYELWEKVFLAEAAIASITDCELLVIKDVTLSWPQFVKKVDPTGEVYYQIPEQEQLESGVCLKLLKPFIETSYDFFQFNVGDFICLRCKLVDISGKKALCVLHMVTKFVKLEHSDSKKSKATIYFKHVSNNANYFTPKIADLLMNCSSSSSFEIQLIPLNLPHRRVYNALVKLSMQESCSKLALDIAIGKATISNFKDKSIKDVLSISMEDASISTSLWPLRRRKNRSGRIKLNKFQRKAIDLATNNKFVVIQGPPGTGKSVTAAHIAYALAMKLRTEKHKYSHLHLRPCVMYCGPSQQSVNVVLDMLTAVGSPARGAGILRVFSRGVEEKEFPGAKYDTELYVKVKTEAKCLPQYEKYALHHIIRKYFSEITRMERKFKDLQDQNKIPSEKMKREYRQLVTKAEIDILKSRVNVEIVLCTCNESSSFRISNSLKPVYCIIDESAMATEPECMVPICSAENVILIGDHRQLQPVIENATAASKGLECSLFERYAESKQRQSVQMLQIQYRMHPAICEFPANEFYEGKLKTDYSVLARRRLSNLSHKFWPNPKKPFVFCNVVAKEDESHMGKKGSQRIGFESKFNVDEAKKIAQIANKLIVDHRLQPNSIAALTPYSAQREEIKKWIKYSGVHVKTVTESQGSEFDVVLLSTVRSKPFDAICSSSGDRFSADIGWLRANLGFITDRHQINVGITRSKYGLIIVGNKALLSYDKTWRNLIEHYRRHNCVVEGSVFP